MSYSASEVINIAKQEVGYLEKATNSMLDSKTGNAGSGNWTKYARDLNAAGYYNGNKNGYAWCDVFVDWVFFKAFGKTAGQSIQCQTGDLGAGCIFSANYYKNAGRFNKTPKIGDQIFFYNGGTEVTHTGLVVKVDNARVYTIEGNTSSASGVVANGGCVAEKSYLLTYSKIYGYGHPKYDVESTYATTQTVSSPVIKVPEKMCTVSIPVLSENSECFSVKVLQILLNKKCKMSLDEDGEFGPLTTTAVKIFQSSNKLVADGIVGKDTWSKLLK